MALSAPLMARMKCVQIKIETTKGTWADPDTDLLCWDVEINPESAWIERKLSAKVMGHTSPGVNDGLGAGTCKFKTELRGSGSNGMDAALAILMQACGVKQATQVYTPTSTYADQKTISIAVYEAGRKKMLSGCAGKMKWIGEPGAGRIVVDCEFSGYWIAPTAGSLPTVAYSTRAPISWGYSTNAFTLATESIKISKFEWDLGNNVAPRYQNGRVLNYFVSDRDPTMTINPESDLVAGYDLYGAWLAGTEVAVSLAITDASDTHTLTIPKFQYRPPKEGERDGILIDDVTGQCNISVINTGDDEWSLAVT